MIATETDDESIIVSYIARLYLVVDGETAVGRYRYMFPFPVVFLQFHSQANTPCLTGASSSNFDWRNDTAIGAQDVGSLRDTHDCMCAHKAGARHELSLMQGSQSLLTSVQR
jgi:hypothetical protein